MLMEKLSGNISSEIWPQIETHMKSYKPVVYHGLEWDDWFSKFWSKETKSWAYIQVCRPENHQALIHWSLGSLSDEVIRYTTSRPPYLQFILTIVLSWLKLSIVAEKSSTEQNFWIHWPFFSSKYCNSWIKYTIVSFYADIYARKRFQC